MGYFTSFTQESKYLNKKINPQVANEWKQGHIIKVGRLCIFKAFENQKVMMTTHYFQMLQASMSNLLPTDHIWPHGALDSCNQSLIQIKFINFLKVLWGVFFFLFTHFYNLIAQNFSMSCIGDNIILLQCKIFGHACKRIVNLL